MREILFRGKRLDNGEWVYGDLLTKYIYHKDLTIVEKGFIYHEVDPETVGQYTGLKDSNGKKIFEGDLLATDLDRPVNEIKFIDGAFKEECYCDGEFYTDFMRDGKKELIVGNIHDNPELLGVKEGG